MQSRKICSLVKLKTLGLCKMLQATLQIIENKPPYVAENIPVTLSEFCSKMPFSPSFVFIVSSSSNLIFCIVMSSFL